MLLDRKLVGNEVAVAVPAPICNVAAAAMLSVPVEVPTIWNAPSDRVPALIVRLPLIFNAAEAVLMPVPDIVKLPYEEGTPDNTMLLVVL